MRIPFRQGLVSFQKISGTPVYLQQSSTNSQYVSHIVEPTPTVAAFAHGGSDYLQVFDTTVDLAWGPIQTGTTTYLFWDIDRYSGQVSYGTTIHEPIVSTIEPINPPNGQHWFDLNTTTMKFWKQSTGAWVEAIRLFAGHVLNGNLGAIYAKNEGTQALLVQEVNAGFLMRDTLLQPLRKSSGEFLTDEDHAHVMSTVGTSGVLVQPVNRVIPVRAGEAIPRMSLVYFSAADTVRLASSNPALIPARIPVGIVTDDLATGDVGTLSTFGEISYDQWDWSQYIGHALYVDSAGQLTVARPGGLMAYRVGFVKNAQTILLSVDAETNPQVYTADVNSLVISGDVPVQITDSINGLGERVVNISIPTVSNATSGVFSTSQFNTFVQHGTRISVLEADILTKAPIAHIHSIGDVSGLQSTLDGKAAINHTHSEYALSAHTHSQYALTSHTHSMLDVSGLAAALDGKADRQHLNSFSEIFSTVDRSGVLDVGSGQTLMAALAAKSDITHTHGISDIANLQMELDGKAFASHTHSISNVNGLQIQLDSKAATVHQHQISDVDLLQSALNTKIAFTNTTAFTPTSDYHPASKKYVDDVIAASGATQLGQLFDVAAAVSDDILTMADGLVLTFNGTTNEWEARQLPSQAIITEVVVLGSPFPTD